MGNHTTDLRPQACERATAWPWTGAWRYRRRLFWIFLPQFLAMLVSTVYDRYHHVADVLAGLIYGAFGFVLGHRLSGWRQAPRT